MVGLKRINIKSNNMKTWNFNVKSNSDQITDKLNSSLNDRFVFKINRDENNILSFKVRKRILYIWYMYFHNWTIINGKLLKTDSDTMTKAEISFTQHWSIILIIYSQMLLGLVFIIAMVSGFSDNTYLILPGGILLGLGVVLCFVVNMKFKKDIKEYKSLISEILEV